MPINVKIIFLSYQNSSVHNIHKEFGNTFAISSWEREKKRLQLNVNWTINWTIVKYP